jgi:hypothetical protein
MQTHMQRRAPEPDSVAADRLDGSGEIAIFWFGADTPEARKRVYRLAEQNVAPIGKLGGRLIASRRALTEFHRQLTSIIAVRRAPQSK